MPEIVEPQIDLAVRSPRLRGEASLHPSRRVAVCLQHRGHPIFFRAPDPTPHCVTKHVRLGPERLPCGIVLRHFEDSHEPGRDRNVSILPVGFVSPPAGRSERRITVSGFVGTFSLRLRSTRSIGRPKPYAHIATSTAGANLPASTRVFSLARYSSSKTSSRARVLISAVDLFGTPRFRPGLPRLKFLSELGCPGMSPQKKGRVKYSLSPMTQPPVWCCPTNNLSDSCYLRDRHVATSRPYLRFLDTQPFHGGDCFRLQTLHADKAVLLRATRLQRGVCSDVKDEGLIRPAWPQGTSHPATMTQQDRFRLPPF